MIFDYTAAAHRAGIAGDKLERPAAIMRAEFPDDEMMAELHILRAVLAVERGEVSLDDILRKKSRADRRRALSGPAAAGQQISARVIVHLEVDNGPTGRHVIDYLEDYRD